jgi:16S rRNA (uracil1498-N3)-methyltransferase
MAHRRFYCPDLSASRLTLDDEQGGHARRSLRLNVGDHVERFDGQGGLAAGRVAEVKKHVSIEVVDRRQVDPPRPTIDLAVALPKGARADVLIEKASELGADRVIPLITERSVVEPRDSKMRRFDRLCVESAKQCGREHLMRIDEPTPLANVLNRADHDLRLIADAALAGEAVQELPNYPGQAGRVIVLIGPEGGWSEPERHAARAAGFAPWRLGPHVMRIETAALAALAILRRHS